MINYTAGFLFHRGEVLLVRKERPDWQRGLLNAIGGKVEPHETSDEAHRREFREETGIDLGDLGWHPFCTEYASRDVERHLGSGETALQHGGTVYFFARKIMDIDPRPSVPETNDVGEKLLWVPVYSVGYLGWECVGNLHWLVPLALDPRGTVAQVFCGADIKLTPTWSRQGALPVSKKVYRHRKRGTSYVIEENQVRVQCATPLRDNEVVLLYRNVDTGDLAVRRESEFMDGRFEELEK